MKNSKLSSILLKLLKEIFPRQKLLEDTLGYKVNELDFTLGYVWALLDVFVLYNKSEEIK